MFLKIKKYSMLLLLYFLLVFSTYIFFIGACKASNQKPIIGVLSQEISYQLNEAYPNKYKSFIAASYVKFIESAGARVVPIWVGQNNTYYKNVLGKINGVLFPGGSTFFNQSDGYADAGNHIYSIAKKLNDQKDYFPLMGICLGFELMTYVAGKRVEHRTHCSSHNQALPLEFEYGFQKSKMFKHASRDIIEILQKENVTANYHKYCVTKKDLAKVNLTHEFRVMSTNNDFNNLRFVSSIEHKKYPFYGLQFHPEKNAFEWIEGKNIPHGKNATKSAHYFAEFFVNEARKNNHFFSSAEEEAKELIYNYKAEYTGLKKSIYEQCYLFK